MKRRRYPAVAGYFYEADREQLIKRIEWSYNHPLGVGKLPVRDAPRDRRARLFIAPHAGYMYSGPVASHTYYHISLSGNPGTFIIAGPNHSGIGSMVATVIDYIWETPLGEVEVDSELAKAIARNSSFLDIDDIPHENEHSIEVQIPFLQHIFGSSFKIVPIAMAMQTIEAARDLANAIAKAVETLGRDVIYIASTDWSHYEPHEPTVKKDLEALSYVERLDPEGFYRYIIERNVTACGPGPTMVFIYLAKIWGYKRARIFKYATSGDVTGEKAWVVGYASATAVYE
ncbi:AmmeMemoRadiSam system protein B [Desulfurococcaceae archaeon AG1]|nr:AmmeMemoRadiSam system protein B [Desulfurococcaceae archaeon AG1]